MRNIILLFFLSLFTGTVWGQIKDTAVAYQLSGIVINSDENEEIPFVSIRINRTRHGVMSNDKGFYSVPVTENDTLYFTHIGYHPARLVVKDYLNEYQVKGATYVYAVTYMRRDTFTLPIVRIFPYNTPEELKTAVINMPILHDSPEAIARENLDPHVIDAIMRSLPIDSEERLMVGRQMYYDYYRNRNLIQTASIDPIAAYQALKYIIDKAKKRKNKDLNYWEDE